MSSDTSQDAAATKKAKGGAKTARTSIVTVRLKPEDESAARVVAQVTRRTLSTLMEYALVRYIEKNFPEAYHAGARVTIKFDDAPVEGSL